MVAMVPLLEATWASLGKLGAGLHAADLARPTGCPGWTVFDQFAHLAGFEAALAGRVDPPIDLPAAVAEGKDDFGQMVERQVAVRRGRPFAEILAELAAVAAERVPFYRQAAAAGDDTVVPGPFGDQPLKRMLPVRLADVWIHEQDIRRALGPAGQAAVGGQAAAAVITQLLGALRGVLAGVCPDGTLVALTVEGPAGGAAQYAVRGGRVGDATPADGDPAVSLRFAPEQFVALAAGRTDADARSVAVAGDQALAAAILARMAVTP
jgi:uncharacterized protein (TIGR03083 family)